ncbi:hypothetical protein Glove_227g51 [Diversispora epigaea]|uniref:Uncharacterized protein n=1 Tax=Diversispora epigaea TaxID=1348612 RepID=A0A397IMH2_9GLOM|nr:hypothetical protein Glove_227g51 [Diversispora epigaea]
MSIFQVQCNFYRERSHLKLHNVGVKLSTVQFSSKTGTEPNRNYRFGFGLKPNNNYPEPKSTLNRTAVRFRFLLNRLRALSWCGYIKHSLGGVVMDRDFNGIL